MTQDLPRPVTTEQRFFAAICELLAEQNTLLAGIRAGHTPPPVVVADVPDQPPGGAPPVVVLTEPGPPPATRRRATPRTGARGKQHG